MMPVVDCNNPIRIGFQRVWGAIGAMSEGVLEFRLEMIIEVPNFGGFGEFEVDDPFQKSSSVSSYWFSLFVVCCGYSEWSLQWICTIMNEFVFLISTLWRLNLMNNPKVSQQPLKLTLIIEQPWCSFRLFPTATEGPDRDNWLVVNNLLCPGCQHFNISWANHFKLCISSKHWHGQSFDAIQSGIPSTELKKIWIQTNE